MQVRYTANIHVAVIDSLTLQSWGKYWVDNSRNLQVVYNPTHAFGNLNNGAGSEINWKNISFFKQAMQLKWLALKTCLITAFLQAITYSFIPG